MREVAQEVILCMECNSCYVYYPNGLITMHGTFEVFGNQDPRKNGGKNHIQTEWVDVAWR